MPDCPFTQRTLALGILGSLLLVACVPVAPTVTESTMRDTTTAEAQEATTVDSTTDGFPLTIENCGFAITYSEPPERAVTMNQAATEIMLALGLEDHLVGTAYMDDEILPEFAAAYESLPVLADEYPSQEVLFNIEPDFVYGVYHSAFGDEAAGPREALNDLDIGDSTIKGQP